MLKCYALHSLWSTLKDLRAYALPVPEFNFRLTESFFLCVGSRRTRGVKSSGCAGGRSHTHIHTRKHHKYTYLRNPKKFMSYERIELHAHAPLNHRKHNVKLVL